MSEVKLTRDHHLLTRNLRLNDNYISNDGGDEGISIQDDGDVSVGIGLVTTTIVDYHDFEYNSWKLKSASGPDNYAKILVSAYGTMTISTVDNSGGNAGNLNLSPQGNVTMAPHGSQGLIILPVTKTVSGQVDSSMMIQETLDMDSGADGSDTHYGIRYDQIQTDLTGWNSVYLMHLTGGDAARTFAIQGDGKVGIGVSDPDEALEVDGNIHVHNTVYFDTEPSTHVGDGATGAIDWRNGNKQKLTMTGTGITINFTNPSGACNLLLKVVQGDGSDVVGTWDGDIKWAGGSAPTLSTGNGEIDILSFYFDGTNYYGVASLNFATP